MGSCRGLRKVDTKRYHILHALLVNILDDAASISTTKHVGRNVGSMSEGTISDFPSGAPMDPPGHFRVLLRMTLLVRDILACMIYLSFAGVARGLGI